MSRTLNELSIDEQKELLVCYDGANLQYISKHRAAQMLNVSRSALRTLLENRKAIEGHRESTDGNATTTTTTTTIAAIEGHRENTDGNATTTTTTDCCTSRSLTLDDVEKCLFRFFVQMINSNLPVTNDILLDRAGAIAAQYGLNNFIPTHNWLIYWKYKNNIPFNPAADHKTDFSRLANEKWLRDLMRYAATVYSGDDVYGLVETGLYFPPDTNRGGERLQRLSVLFLCNVTGTVKKRPVVVENDYRQARFNALMTNHYMSFLKKWSQKLGPKKILLVLDNRSTHPTVELHNIEIKYLPKNIVHPLGRNIVRTVKTYDNQNRSHVSGDESGPTTTTIDDGSASWDYTVSEYVNVLLNTWDRISAADVRDCYRAIGFVMPAENQFDRSLAKNDDQQRQRQRLSSRRAPKADIKGACCVSRDEERVHGGDLPLNLCVKDESNANDNDQCNVPTTPIVGIAPPYQ